jgi:hypothetical protein
MVGDFENKETGRRGGEGTNGERKPSAHSDTMACEETMAMKKEA